MRENERKDDITAEASTDEGRPISNRLLGPYYVGMEEMVWPSVTREVRELEWKLRYARESLTKTECLVLASIVSAYAQMVGDPQKKRNRVCREIRNASRPNAPKIYAA